jgi:DNA-directed RNA polymerase subunit N (RpoN/RPB10)
MLPPVRCFSCGKELSSIYNNYKQLIYNFSKEENDETPQKRALDILKIDRYCCRTVMLGTVELIRELN